MCLLVACYAITMVTQIISHFVTVDLIKIAVASGILSTYVLKPG